MTQNFAELIRSHRKFLGLRQRDLAELAGVTLRGITELEQGRGNPTLKQLSKIADALGLQVTLADRLSNAQR
jgi:y4mF family transcriptional regulator